MWPRAACTRWRGFLGDQLEQWTDTDLQGEAEDEDDAASSSAEISAAICRAIIDIGPD